MFFLKCLRIQCLKPALLRSNKSFFILPLQKDDFPQNPAKNQTDFRRYDTVILDGKGTVQAAPQWFQFDQGREILQTVNG